MDERGFFSLYTFLFFTEQFQWPTVVHQQPTNTCSPPISFGGVPAPAYMAWPHTWSRVPCSAEYHANSCRRQHSTWDIHRQEHNLSANSRNKYSWHYTFLGQDAVSPWLTSAGTKWTLLLSNMHHSQTGRDNSRPWFHSSILGSNDSWQCHDSLLLFWFCSWHKGSRDRSQEGNMVLSRLFPIVRRPRYVDIVETTGQEV